MTSVASSAAALQIDEYRLVRPLRDGEHSDVMLAHDRVLDRAVVLRFLPHDLTAAQALLDGARALARISHPSLSPVYRIRESSERPCVVQGFERGERLDVLIDTRAPLPPRQVLDVGRAVGSALAALHAAGVAHGEVRAERIILLSTGVPRLFGLHGARLGASAEARARDVSDLVAILQRMADPELGESLARLAGTGRRMEVAEDLLVALGELSHPTARADALPASLTENPMPSPYPGLQPFETDQAALFFGRQGDVDEALVRLRSEPWLLVVGRSGAGKSSLVRAGLLPAIAAGALAERARWQVLTLVPGPHPLSALAEALAPLGASNAADLEADLRKDPALAGRLARAATRDGLLLFVDQLEEAMTLADAVERDAFFAALSSFGMLVPGVRAIATLRGDFLDRLSALGKPGGDLLRAGFVVPSMDAQGLRQAIVGPARTRGFEFESTAMVEALADEALTGAGADGLPLLAFVLAELWNERDSERRVLPEAALLRLGGAAATLARHGDRVLASMDTEERAHARRMVLALVIASETRTRCTREALVGGAGASAEAALETLVRGRLVVAGEAYTIAHETLVGAWPRLRAWLDEASAVRSARARLMTAAGEWDRRGRRAELLWGPRQLRDLEVDGALDGASEEALRFVDASRAAVRRAHVRDWALRVGVPVGVLLVAAAIWGAVRWSERQQDHAFVAARVGEAEPLIRSVTDLDAQVATARAEAFARYDADGSAGGEARWHDALGLARREADAFAAASAPLGLALARDPADVRARSHFADLALLWLLAAERDDETAVARDLAVSLAQFDDDGSRRARLAAPAHLSVATAPPGGRVVLHSVHVDPKGYRVEDEARAVQLSASMDLAPGSYILEASAPGHYPTRYPVLLHRGQTERIEIPLPNESAVPPGFVFVPAGDSQLGAADVEGVRAALSAQPQHAVHVGAFLIGVHEVTYGEYLDFLASLTGTERTARLPRDGFNLSYGVDGVPTLAEVRSPTPIRRGDLYCRSKRTARRCQDWLRFPVSSVSWQDAQAYVAWLASGRVPGARLCSEPEWERAARGADGRLYAHGDVLHPGDANFDETYAADAEQTGADEVGSFPIDRSPFLVFDLIGNVAEWLDGALRAAQGGAWSDAMFGARAGRRYASSYERQSGIGMRVCASAPTR